MNRLIIFVLAIAMVSCGNKRNPQEKPFDYRTLPSTWIQLSQMGEEYAICDEADVLILEGNELTRLYVAAGEQDRLEVVRSYQIGDTIVIHAKWLNQDRENDFKMVWLNKAKGISRWIFSDDIYDDALFVPKEKSSGFPKVQCDENAFYDDDDIPSIVSDVKDFVSGKWSIVETIYGDLNNDGQKDVVLLTQKNDPENIIIQSEDSLGPDTLNQNPRGIIIAFKEGDHYRLVAHTNRFLPSPNSIEQPCLADPLEESDGIQISNGVLNISLQYWYSCGSWSVTNNTYTFRFQNNKFELIGFSASSYHRASGEETSVSINYSTKKKQTITGDNMFDEEASKPKETWENIKVDRLYNLEEMDTDMELL